jgi:hypothetical protein
MWRREPTIAAIRPANVHSQDRIHAETDGIKPATDATRRADRPNLERPNGHAHKPTDEQNGGSGRKVRLG